MSTGPVLQLTGAEYFTWTPQTEQFLVQGSVSVSFCYQGRGPVEGTRWWPAEVTEDNRVRLLVLGPDAAPRAAEEFPHQATVEAGRWSCFIQVVDFPETVVRPAGQLVVGG